jgi:hypothetical protein
MPWQFANLTIRPDGLGGRAAAQYEAQLLGMLHSLDAIQTGHAVLNGFRFYRKPVLIYPYDGALGPCTASAQGDWGMFAARVSFTPYLHRRHCQCVTGPSGYYAPGDSPHESLVHELTHAVRAVAGTLSSIPADDEEEIAMLVANIFSSETNRPLRARYQDNTAVPGDPRAYATEYQDENDELIETFHKQHKDFTRWLARVKAPFNPLRLYFDRTRPPGW